MYDAGHSVWAEHTLNRSSGETTPFATVTAWYPLRIMMVMY